MGNCLEESRKRIIDFDEKTDKCNINFWVNCKKNPIWTQEENHGTLFPSSIVCACREIASYFEKINNDFTKKLNILEVGSGNGYNTRIINVMLNQVIKTTIIATDLFSYEPSYFNIHSNILSHDAVKKYGNDCNVLMLISPPCHDFMDYYAIKTFEEINDKEKFIIYIGELGASDGAEGMYNYMMNHDLWKLEHRSLVIKFPDVYGGNTIKEAFIFKSNEINS